jgi:hypothetical protein
MLKYASAFSKTALALATVVGQAVSLQSSKTNDQHEEKTINKN